MNIRAQFYLDIQAQLKTLAKIKHIDLYNNQLAHLDEEESFHFPSVFIEFGKIPWLDKSGKAQEANVDIMIHIVSNSKIKTSSKSDNGSVGLAHLELVDDIHFLLRAWTGNYFRPLRRIMSEPDHDHDNLWEDIETYSTHFTDTAVATVYTAAADVKPNVSMEVL